MIDPRDPNWTPTPELLAAFADGELDERDETAELRARIERWLADNPAAQAELDANRRLRALWDKTTPAEPTAEAWRKTVAGIRRPAPGKRSANGRILVGAALVACLGWALLLLGDFTARPQPKPAEVEVFQVAQDADVEIIHIEGSAIDSVVVGRLPLDGPLELADPGDVLITNIAPRDNMRPMPAQRRPILWAKDEGEGD